jgi:hypothetical protein
MICFRYLAVYNTFDRRNIICRNGNKILFLIWVFGSLYAFCGSKDIKTFPFKPNKLFNQSEDQMLKNTTWFVCSMTSNFVITFAFPLVIITVCYLLIAKKLINNRNAGSGIPLRRNNGGNGDIFKVSEK